MKMKILLISVSMLETDNNFYPPLGILYIASVLKKEGCEVKVINKVPDSSNYSNFLSEIREFNPDAIGLSFMTSSYEKAFNISKVLRKEFPKTILFSGGIHTTILPEKTIKELDLDFIVIGEGEKTIAEVYNKLKNKKSLNEIKGIMFKEGKKIIKNPPRELIENLDELPFPDRSLVSFKRKYLIYPGMEGAAICNSTTMGLSRGCPARCIYCASKLVFGKKVRYRSTENIIAEIKHLVNDYGIEGIKFVDDTFTMDSKRVIDFCKAIKKENIKIKWACMTRVDTISEEVLKEMKSAGCVQLDFGVESGSDKILKILKKGTNTKMIKDAFKLVKKYKMKTLATIIVNNPFETKEDLEKTFKLAKEISADCTLFFYFVPFPGTESYELAEKQGWLKDNKNFSNNWNFRTAQLPVMGNATDLTREELMKIRSKMQNYFFMKNYFRMVNLIFISKLSYQALLNPKVTFKAVKEVMKTKRLDGALEIMFSKIKI